MKISIIGPATQIPPVGWGAVESLIWDYSVNLKKEGHEVDIINIANPKEIIKRVNEFSPDFVHIQYDDWIVLYPYIQYPCACTTHFAYIERPDMMNGYGQIFSAFQIHKPNVFCLSEGIKRIYSLIAGIPDEKLYTIPNGVDKRFNDNHNYLGEWTKEYLHDYLTDYGNLVLLSDGEAHSLVIMEAFAAGLGVVVSEFATANLDLDKEFITVIPEDKIDDPQFVEYAIKKNREYSVAHRDEILKYAKQFSWENIIKTYYLPTVRKVIG